MNFGHKNSDSFKKFVKSMEHHIIFFSTRNIKVLNDKRNKGFISTEKDLR